MSGAWSGPPLMSPKVSVSGHLYHVTTGCVETAADARSLAGDTPQHGRQVGQCGGWSGRLPVASGAELDGERAQVRPAEIVQRRELVLAARVVQPPDGEFVAISVGQPEEPPGGEGLGDVLSDGLAGPGLADRGWLGPVVAGGRILGDDPAIRRGQ